MADGIRGFGDGFPALWNCLPLLSSFPGGGKGSRVIKLLLTNFFMSH